MRTSKSIFLFILILSFGCKTENNHSQTQEDNTSKNVSDFNFYKIAEFDNIIKMHYSLDFTTPDFAHTNQKHQYKQYRKIPILKSA